MSERLNVDDIISSLESLGASVFPAGDEVRDRPQYGDRIVHLTYRSAFVDIVQHMFLVSVGVGPSRRDTFSRGPWQVLLEGEATVGMSEGDAATWMLSHLDQMDQAIVSNPNILLDLRSANWNLPTNI